MEDIVEIRWHGRGGQGAVTSTELIALAAINEGKNAQSFPSFGPERRGAPVLAFLRVSESTPIRIRANIYEPDAVVVLDPSLVETVDVTSGLKEGGIVIINTKKPDEMRAKFGNKWQVATVDAIAIARETIGLPITNTTMIGALLKVVDIVKLDSLSEPLEHRFGKVAWKNADAMRKAYEQTSM